jgi:hypothetical protein
MDMTTFTSSNFGQWLSPSGRAVDSAPAIAHVWVTNPPQMSSMAFAHMNNGQWWKLDMFNVVWTQFPNIP